MNVPWSPVIAVDIAGSVITLVIALRCACIARQWTVGKPEDIFRHYIFLLTMAIVFFAISRSFGHLVKQVLMFSGQVQVWNLISPFSGAINSATFIVIFAFSIYFYRVQEVRREMVQYQDNLEALVEKRTTDLERTNAILEREIVERQQAEEGLRQSKTTLENVINNSNPLCITNIDFEVLRANNAYYDLWAGAETGTERIKCYDSRPGSLCHTSRCPLIRIIAGEKVVSVETTKLNPSGETLFFIVTARPFYDADGQLVGIVENFQDITARKLAEDALAAERERLSVTLRSIGDGVITTDISGKIILINKVAEKLTGWPQDQAVGRMLGEVFNIVNSRTRRPCENPVDQILASNRIITLAKHTVLIARDGRERNIADSGAPIRDQKSRVVGVVLVFRDITDTLRMEEELLKIKKLESVGVLAGGIAHDFNNILVAILGNIDMAAKLAEPGGKIHQLLMEAAKASLRAKDLTKQLLTFSKGGEPVKEAASIPEVIMDSADFVLHGEKMACRYDIPDDLWLVEIDKGQMSQVIQNLVLNARDAMPEGGMIRVECENLATVAGEEAPLPEDQRYVKITIRDNGAGIPAEVIDRIFDPYFSTKPEGSGLGLAVVHSIISKHKGHICVESRPGEGATFVIYLPASAEEDQPEKKVAPPLIEEKGKIKVLVMDDEEIVRDAALNMLEYLDVDVVLARDGAEAVAIYQQAADSAEPIDLVIMDLTIPGGMGGQEAVAEIHKINPEARVIVSSGYSNDPVLANFQAHGFCAAMVKPFRIEDLKKAIDQALS